MNTDKWKRILAGFLAILCLLTSPMSVYASGMQKSSFAGKRQTMSSESAQSEMPQRQTEQQMQTEKQKQTEQKREEGLESESASKKNPEIKQESEEQKNPETKKDPGSQENLESQRKQESKENTVQGSSDQTEKVMDSMKISQTERQKRKVSGEEETEKNPKVKKQSAKNEARAASDSIYLTVRSSAVTLDKASGVKVGNVKTQLPDGYEGYIRRTAKCFYSRRRTAGWQGGLQDTYGKRQE